MSFFEKESKISEFFILIRTKCNHFTSNSRQFLDYLKIRPDDERALMRKEYNFYQFFRLFQDSSHVFDTFCDLFHWIRNLPGYYIQVRQIRPIGHFSFLLTAGCP